VEEKMNVPLLLIGLGGALLFLLTRKPGEGPGEGPGGLRPGQTVTCDIPGVGPSNLTLIERSIENNIAWWKMLNHESGQEEWITEENLLSCI